MEFAQLVEYNKRYFSLEMTQKMKQEAYNDFHNVLRLFDVLLNFAFTIREMMRDYYF